MKSTARNNVIDYIELPAADAASLAKAKAFLSTVFGWQFKDWGAEYVDTASSGVNSGIAVNPKRVGRPMPVIFCDDLESARKNVLAAGAQLTKDIYSFPGGRRFEFTDPAGNELAVWSDK